MYLALTVDLRVALHPETFKDIYLYFTNGQWLSNRDLEDHDLGGNLYSNKAEKIIGEVSMTFDLMHWAWQENYISGWRSLA
ncbi:MAG: hypothetical protein G01um101433_1076, partial [Parcubacteria group bacterium Gr01-1014_33]